MTDWPAPVSAEVIARQRKWLTDQIGPEALENYKNMLKRAVNAAQEEKTMTHTELSAILARIGGPSARGLSIMHGVSYFRATRWLTGQMPIPKPVADWWENMDRWLDNSPVPPRAW